MTLLTNYTLAYVTYTLGTFGSLKVPTLLVVAAYFIVAYLVKEGYKKMRRKR